VRARMLTALLLAVAIVGWLVVLTGTLVLVSMNP
jgi:hypothetical protein